MRKTLIFLSACMWIAACQTNLQNPPSTIANEAERPAHVRLMEQECQKEMQAERHHAYMRVTLAMLEENGSNPGALCHCVVTTFFNRLDHNTMEVFIASYNDPEKLDKNRHRWDSTEETAANACMAKIVKTWRGLPVPIPNSNGQ